MGATGVGVKSFTTGSGGPILTHSQATVQKQKLKTKTKNRVLACALTVRRVGSLQPCLLNDNSDGLPCEKEYLL